MVVNVLFVSCKKTDQKLDLFLGFKKMVNNEAFKDFPITEENFGTPYILSTVYPSVNERRNAGVFITYQYDDIKIFESKVSEVSATAVNPKSTNRFVVPDSLGVKLNEIDQSKIPVPNLKDSISYLYKVVDPEKSKIFVFNHGEGNYFRKPFDLPNGKYKVKGYSSGLIADESEHNITYWIIVW